METRVLTLFDDEDFFPKEEAPKKPVKKATEKIPETEAAAEEPEPPVPAVPEHKETFEEPVAIPASDTDQQPQLPENEMADSAADHSEPDQQEVAQEEEATEQEVSPEEEVTEEEVAAAEQPVQPGVHAADEELNKQILSELIQLDYTALIHRDYPFDVQQARVVQKDKEVKLPEPEAAVQEETTVTTATAEEEEDEVFEEVVPLPEWNLDKKYYTIGEVAQLFTVNTSHIRFWTNEFKLKPRTTRKGDRLYSPKDIAELRLIHHLVKEKKHTIKGAREKLKVEKTGVNQKLDLKESLTGLRDMLVQIKEQL